MRQNISLKRIGVVHTPYKELSVVPRRPDLSTTACTVEIFAEYEQGLLHLEEFSHIYLLSWLHRMSKSSLLVTPPHEKEEHGVFATRSPIRPNPIALSFVSLLKCEGRFLEIAGCDLLDQTPLLDIKPYRPEEIAGEVRFGWYGHRMRKSAGTS
jgi:tRNA (adenine37-N6)-methyltransferase